jgi:hypothetical protein
LGAADGYASVLLRSVDGGVTFERVLVPETNVERMAYLAAVHPLDPARVYLRVDDTAGTVVWSSEDGGVTLRKRFTGRARLVGFALSPDGTRIALGGPDDGLWLGPTDGASFERRSDIGPSCLGWNADGLHACADARQAGFSLGLSRDEGATFAPLVRFASLCGRSTCGAATEVGKLCPGQWDTVAAALGGSCADGGADDGDAADSGAAEGGPRYVADASGGCSLDAARAPPLPTCSLPFAVLLLLGRRRRSIDARGPLLAARRACASDEQPPPPSSS